PVAERPERAIDDHKPYRLLGILAIELPDHGCAHAVSDKNRARDTGIFEYGINCPGKQIHGISDLGLVAHAVSRKIDRDDLRSIDEGRYLVAPETHVTSPPVHKHQRVAALAVALIVHAIGIKLRESRWRNWQISLSSIDRLTNRKKHQQRRHQ